MPAPETTKPIRRGEIYKLKSAYRSATVMIVSNDLRNAALSSVLVARITASPKPSIPTVVDLPSGEPVIGRVLCDRITEIPKDGLGKCLGVLSHSVVRLVDRGVAIALGLG